MQPLLQILTILPIQNKTCQMFYQLFVLRRMVYHPFKVTNNRACYN